MNILEKFKVDKFYITVDPVIFTVINDELKILLIKRKHPPFQDMFALPGGFIKSNEELEQAALRELEEETGVKNVLLKQLNAYGQIGRDSRGRVISIPFFALINSDKIKLKSKTDAYDAEWVSAYKLPKLGFDHKKIIGDALNYLKSEIQKSNLAFQIMSEKFTFSELQHTYEAVLNEELDKRNFRKKMRELDLLKELKETKMEGAHRPAKLCSFKQKNYFRFAKF